MGVHGSFLGQCSFEEQGVEMGNAISVDKECMQSFQSQSSFKISVEFSFALARCSNSICSYEMHIFIPFSRPRS